MSGDPPRIAVLPGDGIAREVIAEVVLLAEELRRDRRLNADLGGNRTNAEVGTAVRERMKEKLGS